MPNPFLFQETKPGPRVALSLLYQLLPDTNTAGVMKTEFNHEDPSKLMFGSVIGPFRAGCGLVGQADQWFLEERLTIRGEDAGSVSVAQLVMWMEECSSAEEIGWPTGVAAMIATVAWLRTKGWACWTTEEVNAELAKGKELAAQMLNSNPIRSMIENLRKTGTRVDVVDPLNGTVNGVPFETGEGEAPDWLGELGKPEGAG